jgi:hypothetical protein
MTQNLKTFALCGPETQDKVTNKISYLAMKCQERFERVGFEGGLFRLTLASMIQGWVKPCVKSSIIACRDQDQCNCQESQIEADPPN